MTRRSLLSALVIIGAVSVFLLPGAAGSSSSSLGNLVLARGLDIELGLVQPGPKEQRLSSGVMYAVLQASGELEKRANAVSGGSPGAPNSPSCQSKFTGGGTGASVNVRVNQDCSLRRQAEEVVVANPTNPDNLIAGQNDSRIGFNHCGYDFSFDGGKTWGDQTPPFWQFTLLDQHTADACSDPTATFDSKGNAYVGGIIFNVTSPANVIVVAKSNKGIGGAFYHTPDSTLSFQTYRTLPLGVVANDLSPTIFNDKEFIVADATATSPKADNVYATWTRFDLSQNNSPIYFSQSTNGGRTWSTGVEISGSNPAVCTFLVPGRCDQDQGSHPIVGPDGTIYVAFGNANTPLVGINQILIVKCPPSANCSQSASWTAPVKINDLIDNHPTGPDSTTGCPSGRQCLPPNGYRVPEFTSISISVDKSSKLYAVWADFRNGGGTCTGSASTATPPCDNDVFYATSTNGGATWSAERNVAPAAKFGPTAQWQPWSDVTSDGSTLWIAYYDRSYGSCESTGCNDITLAKVANPASATPTIGYTRLTTSSMPNLVPANNPIQAGFLGDYMWVDVLGIGRPHVVWADTRGRNNTVEEDIYYASTP
jgi:hypothetical protein